MKSKDVQLGGTYVVKVSGKLTRVRLDSESPYGGWVGTNLQTKHQVRIKTAAKLRREFVPTTLFEVRYQEHVYTDLSDNPTPKTWRIKAETPEQAFEFGQTRAMRLRSEGHKIGHVFRELRREDGSIVVADGDYLNEAN